MGTGVLPTRTVAGPLGVCRPQRHGARDQAILRRYLEDGLFVVGAITDDRIGADKFYPPRPSIGVTGTANSLEQGLHGLLNSSMRDHPYGCDNAVAGRGNFICHGAVLIVVRSLPKLAPL
jgi:hypothetical protein